MLLFVRKEYSDAILDGRKTYEMRAGSRYGKLREGHELSINGYYRVRITRVDHYTNIDKLICALSHTAFPLTHEQVRSCYPDATRFYVFHFTPPVNAPRRVVA